MIAIATDAVVERQPIDRLTGASRALRREKTLRAQIFHPPPRYTVSEWADRHRYLSRMSSAEEGRWRTSRAPYQRGIMDAISDPTVQRVCWMAPSQTGKSELLLCTIGYYIDQDPAPMLMVQPSIEMARDFSEDRVKMMIEVSPRLRAKVHVPTGRREAGNKMLRKAFPGGHLTLVGANSATGLASRPIRIVLFDEVDKYPPSAGDKGDPISLASNRTKTFWNRKIVIVTTPGVKGASRIEKEWAESDQRRYFVPCPHCHHKQHLQWARISFDDASYVCESCACTIEERHKAGMLAKGEWIATNPNGTFPGFHLNALYSPWTTWKEMIAKFLVAKKAPDTLRVFVNEDLAELWDPNDGDAFDTDTLKGRRENYPAEVPNDVGILTAFVDVQRDWLELTVRGWCAGQRSYLIAHHRIQGDPALPHVWDKVEVYRTKAYQHESGATLKIAALGVDSGDGQTVQHVYRYVAPKQKQGVYATKGLSVRGRPIVNRPSKRNKYGVRIFPLGTETAKDLLFQRLKIVWKEGDAPPGYLHFPQPLPEGGCDDEYLDQFGREQVFIRHVHGVPIREYHTVPKGARNEAVDLEVGCIAMLHLLGSAVYDQLSVWAAKVQAEGAKLRPAPSIEGAPPAPAAPVIPSVIPKIPRGPRRPGGYINGWRR